MSAAPDATYYHQYLTTGIIAENCKARRTHDSVKDCRWKPVVYGAFQCTEKAVTGTDLCTKCSARKCIYDATASIKDSNWHGIVTDPDSIPAESHIYGSTWFTVKPKWIGTAESTTTPTAPTSSSNAAPITSTANDDKIYPNIGETIYCSFGRGAAAKHEYSATFSLHSKNGTRIFTVNPENQPTLWRGLDVEFASPSGFAVACEMSHKGTTTRSTQNGWDKCYVKRDGATIKLNDLPPQVIVSEPSTSEQLTQLLHTATPEQLVQYLANAMEYLNEKNAHIASLEAENAAKDAHIADLEGKLGAIRTLISV